MFNYIFAESRTFFYFSGVGRKAEAVSRRIQRTVEQGLNRAKLGLGFEKSKDYQALTVHIVWFQDAEN